jgi:hypothetical protein
MYIDMKKKLYYFTVAAFMFNATSCEDFLDTESFTQKNTGNFPVTETDANQMMAAIYNTIGLALAANGNYVQGSFYMASELAGDDRLGGGGSGDQQLQALDLMREFSIDQSAQFWSVRYQGINRANNAIETLNDVELPDAKKQKFLGEAYFLRAFFYYELASMYERVPLHLATAPEDLPQAAPDQTWGQIIADLKTAIEIMPNEKTPASEAGHADKYTAEALMARAFLFYTGFYGKADVTLPDGSTVTKANVIAWIDDCVNNSGYTLVPKFHNLWPYSNRITKSDYSYTKGLIDGGESVEWVEDDMKVNPETMLAVKFNKFAGYGFDAGFTNGYAVFTGMRGGDADWAFPFGQGWGAGPVATNLWSEWDDADPRKRASICDVNAELGGYPKGGGWGDWVQETGYFFKKGSTISAKENGSRVDPFEKLMYDMSMQWDLCIIHDLILIRFADVLLMQSELKGDAAGMNRVRERAGLQPTSYSLDNIQKERRFELAFEGVRWNDMRRWGATYAKTALAKQGDLPIYNKGVADVNRTASFYTQRYDATRGFFSIPNAEIILSDGLYHQNEGWDNSSIYTGW